MNSGVNGKRPQDGREVIEFELDVSGLAESQHVKMTEMRKIMVTPTLVKFTPPSFRIVGDLTQADKLVEKILILNDMTEDGFE